MIGAVQLERQPSARGLARRLEPAPHRGRAVLALARSEGWRLVRHPAVLFGLALSIPAYLLATLYYGAPVMQRDDVLTGAALFPVAAGTLLAANFAALRSRRHGTDELYEAQALSRDDRTLAHLLSVAWGAGLAVVCVVFFVLTLLLRKPVGSPDMLELATGPAIVAAAGILGVLLARRLPTAAAGPIAIVALGALVLWVSVTGSGGQIVASRSRWLAPWVSLSNEGNPARELAIWPAGWHLLYLVGWAIAGAGIALARHGRRPSRLAIAAGGVALTVAAGAVLIRPLSPAEASALADALLHPERYQICERRMDVRFCAYPGYVGWIDRWAHAVTSVVQPVPPPYRPGGMTVRQTFATAVYGSDLDGAVAERLLNDQRSLDRPAVRTGAGWSGTGVSEPEEQIALALGIAAWVVGLPVTGDQVVLTKADIRRMVRASPPQERKAVAASLHPGDRWASCTPAGQARGVVALWLAGQASPSMEARLRAAAAEREIRRPIPPAFFGTEAPEEAIALGDDVAFAVARDESFVSPQGNAWLATGGAILWTRIEAEYALQLLDRPRAEVAMRLAAIWPELVGRRTHTEELVRLLRLRTVPTIEQRLVQAGLSDEVAARAARSSRSSDVPCR